MFLLDLSLMFGAEFYRLLCLLVYEKRSAFIHLLRSKVQ